jgi:hypothetical protein
MISIITMYNEEVEVLVSDTIHLLELVPGHEINFMTEYIKILFMHYLTIKFTEISKTTPDHKQA